MYSDAVAAMSAAIAHRGPDGSGLWPPANGEPERPWRAVVAHRLLAIVDRRGVAQPMVAQAPTGPVVLSFNGEIDNWKELRSELQARGYRFETSSDTEVLLVLYLVESEREPAWRAAELVAQRLEGMFAFAIWDERTERLLLVRDHSGVKPLYYCPTPDGGVLFASEPKAIFAHPLGRASIGTQGWRVMYSALDPREEGTWEGVPSVPTGTVVTVDRGGIRQRRFWRLQSRARTDSPAATKVRVRSLLDEIVGRQVDRDVSVGTLLSGGIDSSLVSALAARATSARGERISSFVIDFTGHREHLAAADVLHDSVDAEFAAQVAEMCGTRHHRVLLDSGRLADPALRERVVRARDAAMGLGDQDVSRLLLFEFIREQRVKSVLSGEMFDELFAGYLTYTDDDVLHGDGWPWLLYRGGLEQRTRMSTLTPEFREALDLDEYIADSYADAIRAVGRLPGESPREHRIRQISYLDINGHAQWLLAYSDALSMASGVEVQVPGANRRLIEYAYNTPSTVKFAGGRVKGLLIDAADGLLPRSVLDRKKSAFPSTTDPGYLLELQSQSTELGSRRQHPVLQIIDRDWLSVTAAKPVAQVTYHERFGMPQALELAALLDIYHPTISL
jgi:asparagine synthase (glutamine-hydrolysing)